MVRPIDGPRDLLVDATTARQKARRLELKLERRERVGEHVVHLPGQPASLGGRRPSLRLSGRLQRVALIAGVAEQAHGEEPGDDPGHEAERATALGSVALLVTRAVLVPLLARPTAGVLGRPLRVLFGTPGRLGRENAMRNPGRTAQTAAALMIGIGLVSTIGVLGGSLTTSATDQINSAVNADCFVTSSGGFSRSVPSAISRLPGATATTSVYRGQFEFRGALSSLAAVTPAGLPQTVDLHVISGSGAAALRRWPPGSS